MGNLNVDSINHINVNSGFMRDYGAIENAENLLSTCNKNGIWRIINCNAGHPPDSISQDNDSFVNAYIAEDNQFVRLQVLNVKNSNVWQILCINGVWESYELLPNNFQIQGKMDLKVDKNGKKQLSDENFTTTYKNAMNELINTNYFKGYFDTIADIEAFPSPKNGIYGFVIETSTIWYYNNGWRNLHNESTGDMKRIVYDPNNKSVDVYDRSNHTGVQAIETIESLNIVLDEKLDIADKTKVIDNFNSSSPLDALSANMGKNLQQGLVGVISGGIDINFQSNLSENGWCKIGKLMLQWGKFDMGVGHDNDTKEVTFNVPFDNMAFVVVANPVSNTSQGSGGDFCSTQIINNTKFWLVKDYASTSNASELYWFALGF